MFLKYLPPMPTGKNKMSIRANESKEKYTDNFVNKYYVQYVEKQQLKAEVDRLNGIVEEQKQLIAKIIANGKTLADAQAQTDEIFSVNVEVQTDESNVGTHPEKTTAGIQTGILYILLLFSLINAFHVSLFFLFSGGKRVKRNTKTE